MKLGRPSWKGGPQAGRAGGRAHAWREGKRIGGECPAGAHRCTCQECPGVPAWCARVYLPGMPGCTCQACPGVPVWCPCQVFPAVPARCSQVYLPGVPSCICQACPGLPARHAQVYLPGVPRCACQACPGVPTRTANTHTAEEGLRDLISLVYIQLTCIILSIL